LNDLLFGPLANMRERQVLSESFLTLPLIVPRTRLVAALPSRLGEYFTRNAEIRLVRPPEPIVGFSESMSWNASSDGDPAHAWLRQQLKLVAAQHLCTSLT
jgi:DNA-binding transcriptional LysR family regulator